MADNQEQLTNESNNEQLAYIFLDRMALITPDGRIYETFLYKEGMEFNDDMIDMYGVLKFPYVYMYKGKAGDTPPDQRECGVYSRENGTAVFISPKTEEEKDMYHISKVVEFNPQSFLDKIKREIPQILSREDLERINSSGNILNVEIFEEDDFLKRAIKLVVQDKQISLKSFEGRTDKDKPYGLSNLRSALVKQGQKMSTTRFLEWADLFDLEWELTIRDSNPDGFSPLSKPVVVKSSDVPKL